MKIELESSDIQAIAEKVAELIKPMLSGQQDTRQDELISVEGVARILNKSKGQVYQWVNNSQHGLFDFPYMKAGKSLRFSKNAILQWMKQHGNG
ncbi:MAG: helix-turn-helix domain-containing protein [Proteobacteria bacterium]|nr:helix-turn-helix domain-containing protein [Pseudomonadota bacterium]